MARAASTRSAQRDTEREQHLEEVLLVCPVRGPLGASALAKDGLTPTEEARRVDFLHFLIDERNYLLEHIRVEVVTVKNLGESGRNQLRADVIVYDRPWAKIANSDKKEQLGHAILVAEIKRDSSKKARGISQQLEPALLLLPRLDTMGVYWDDESRILFTKSVSKKRQHEEITIHTDSIANLPDYGIAYHSKAITVDTLTKPANLVATLQGLANIMRSHGVNDEQTRYKETVKLLLARYVDEKKARGSDNKQLRLQVLGGEDAGFMSRVERLYNEAALRYQRVQTLFAPRPRPELDEKILRDLVRAIEGFDFSSASSDTMQQVFMTFVPVVFKKNLSQYFTPASLIDTMVQMVAPGPTEKIADPAMGTADFLTSALNFCIERGDDDAFGRIYGIDSDPSAYDLAIVNMILNRDGQANLRLEDSIEAHTLWAEQMDVVLCNPPFGAKTIEKRPEVLDEYDLGHMWVQGDAPGSWLMTDAIAKNQQLGILFIERCWKMLRPGGRLAIILPEGYLSTAAYGYVRQWILDHFIVRSLVELPRRIFVKSDADLRSNILIAEKREPGQAVQKYPIHASMVRRVGYKLGGDFKPLPLQDKATGIPIRDNANRIVLDSDFHRVLEEFAATPKKITAQWKGATIADIVSRIDLDMKPRRLVPRALENIRTLKAEGAVSLSEIADVLDEKIDLLTDIGASEFRRVVEGQDIRAIEGLVIPHFSERCWAIAERKQRKVYRLRNRDIVVGLVRPERRNVGILLDDGDDVVGSPDGLAVVRIRAGLEEEYPTAWLFAVLRSEQVRLQFWTESGGTSYGKLDDDRIRNVLIPLSTLEERCSVAGKVEVWIETAKEYSDAWSQIGIDGDRRPILNSPLIGLFDDDDEEMETGAPTEDERDAEVARKRLAEVKASPGKLVKGNELAKRLARLEP
jgi:type I restriction enzyme M protein